MENNLVFVAEQDGDIEREFKKRLTEVFLNYPYAVRAYLVLTTTTEQPNAYQVMLCLRTNKSDDLDLVQLCADEFKKLFADDQLLDISFLSDDHEKLLREICCPFYTSDGYQVKTPDFYLFSSEGYDLNDTVRSCRMRKRLHHARPDGYMICDISPPIIGQKFGLGDKDIHQVVLCIHYQGSTLRPTSEWPMSVYVMRMIDHQLNFAQEITEDDYKMIGLAELYQKPDDFS